MKVTIVTIGTRGDVQPYVALGKALQARGHQVRLAGPDNFAEWVTSHGLAFHPTGIDIEAFLQSPEVKEVTGGNWFALARVWREGVVPNFRKTLDETWAAGRDADVLVYHPKAQGTVDVAEATGASAICATTVPMVPTGEFPFLLWTRDFGPRLNRLSYAPLKLSRVPYRKVLNQWRASLGLGKGAAIAPIGSLCGKLLTRLCMVSPAVLPRPADWDADAHMTGYWFLDEGRDWRPDGALASFLDAGEPPIYIGFGSMTTKHPERLAREVVDGVRQAGVRAILATGWGGMSAIDVPEALHVIKGAPHDVLFQRVSAVVHHGGAGTTAAGLRAGRPTLVCPLTVDQPFWGHRVWRLGCGPEPLSLRKLRAQPLAQRLRQLVDTRTYRDRAAAVAARVATEDGVARAVETIESAGAGGRERS